MQTRTQSVIEALTNIIAGAGVNFYANLVLLPMILHVSAVPLVGNLQITAAFTVISIVRQYVLRRLFNSWHRVPAGFIPTVFARNLKGN